MEKLDLRVPSDGKTAAPSEVSMRVVEELETTLGCEATGFEPLAASVDPDALDRVVESASAGTVLAFGHADCQIQLRKDGSDVIIGVSRERDIPN